MSLFILSCVCVFLYSIHFVFTLVRLWSWSPVESLNNGHLLLSPPHNNSQMQRENMQVTQPSSVPSSPLTSPGAQSSTSFTMPNTMFTIDTGDPNWQATKPTVRERNAAMFNNELMSDISFIVGSDGKSNKFSKIFISMHYNVLLINTIIVILYVLFCFSPLYIH